MNTLLLKTAVRVWLMEILVSGFNFFVLMNLLYEPRWGYLVAHQIGMSSRIVYISIFAYLLLRYVKRYETKDLIHVGLLWLGLTLAFEWLGKSRYGAPGRRDLGWLERIRGVHVAIRIVDLSSVTHRCRHSSTPR